MCISSFFSTSIYIRQPATFVSSSSQYQCYQLHNCIFKFWYNTYMQYNQDPLTQSHTMFTGSHMNSHASIERERALYLHLKITLNIRKYITSFSITVHSLSEHMPELWIFMSYISHMPMLRMQHTLTMSPSSSDLRVQEQNNYRQVRAATTKPDCPFN